VSAAATLSHVTSCDPAILHVLHLALSSPAPARSTLIALISPPPHCLAHMPRPHAFCAKIHCGAAEAVVRRGAGVVGRIESDMPAAAYSHATPPLSTELSLVAAHCLHVAPASLPRNLGRDQDNLRTPRQSFRSSRGLSSPAVASKLEHVHGAQRARGSSGTTAARDGEGGSARVPTAQTRPPGLGRRSTCRRAGGGTPREYHPNRPPSPSPRSLRDNNVIQTLLTSLCLTSSGSPPHPAPPHPSIGIRPAAPAAPG
jgi:hypothetical protein